MVIAERDGAAVRVLSAESFPKADTASLRAMLERQGKPALVRVIPGAHAITRLVRVPSGTSDEIMAALDLIAEAELPSTIPGHRRAAGIIPSAISNGTISALLLGWPAGETPEALSESDRYTTETAALNALLAPIEGASAAYADQSTGSISLFARQNDAFVVRALREDPSADRRWQDALNSASAIVGADPAQSGRGGLLMDQAAASRALSRVGGASAETQWLDRYAIALGAALGSLNDSPSVRALYSLTPERERIARPLHERALLAVTNTRTALLVVLIALAAALLAPLAGAFLQYQVLVAKSGGLEQRQIAERATDERLTLYRELEDRTWPMTKVLGDLSGAIPVGVSIDSVQLIQGDEIRVSGTADSAEVLSQMQATIATSGVFGDPTLPRIERDGESATGPVEFDLNARVIRPYATPRNTENYAEQSLAVRMYGAEAVARYPDDITGLVSPENAASADTPSGRRASRGASDDGDEAIRTRTRARANDGESNVVPDPLTDEEIVSMERPQLMKEFGSRKKASSYPELSSEDEQRLKDEVAKIRERLSNRGGG